MHSFKQSLLIHLKTTQKIVLILMMLKLKNKLFIFYLRSQSNLCKVRKKIEINKVFL